MKRITWNESTWYSVWAAIIFLGGVVPVLMFYLGYQYQTTLELIDSSDIHIQAQYTTPKSNSQTSAVGDF